MKKIRLGRGAAALAVIVGMTMGAIVATSPATAAYAKSGTKSCAGGPTAYAGVTYNVNSSGSVIFTNLANYNQQDTWEITSAGSGTVYSPWTSVKWEVIANNVISASGVCY